MTQAPGWYPDQNDPTMQRYWDGQGWSAPSATQPAWGAYQQPPPVVPPPPAPKKRRGLLIVVPLVLLLIAAGVVLAVAKPWSSGAKKVHVHGTFDLVNGDFLDPNYTSEPAGGCSGTSGYNDLSDGTEVVISDDTGKTLALTELQDGSVTGTACEWTFDADVAAGRKFYGITVSHRGTIKEQESDLSHVSLTIGS